MVIMDNKLKTPSYKNILFGHNNNKNSMESINWEEHIMTLLVSILIVPLIDVLCHYLLHCKIIF